MTVKEWREAGRDCTENADGTFMFRCSESEAADLPTDAKAGSVACIDDGAALSGVQVLRKSGGAAAWISYK